LQELNCNINVIQYNEISIMNKYKENSYAKWNNIFWWKW
jgi:hypothetical protein